MQLEVPVCEYGALLAYCFKLFRFATHTGKRQGNSKQPLSIRAAVRRPLPCLDVNYIGAVDEHVTLLPLDDAALAVAVELQQLWFALLLWSLKGLLMFLSLLASHEADSFTVVWLTQLPVEFLTFAPLGQHCCFHLTSSLAIINGEVATLLFEYPQQLHPALPFGFQLALRLLFYYQGCYYRPRWHTPPRHILEPRHSNRSNRCGSFFE